MSISRQIIALVLLIAICLGIGGIGSVFTIKSVGTWYESLRKPVWTPPSWVFGPVWTLLYIAMGVAAWLVWRKLEFSQVIMPLTIFGLQLLFNLAWSWIFFGLRQPGLAMLDIGFLWILILATMIVFWRITPLAGWLFLPYLLWVSYAATLNFGIIKLNPSK